MRLRVSNSTITVSVASSELRTAAVLTLILAVVACMMFQMFTAGQRSGLQVDFLLRVDAVCSLASSC